MLEAGIFRGGGSPAAAAPLKPLGTKENVFDAGEDIRAPTLGAKRFLLSISPARGDLHS
jgi:hypothetical protein